MNDVTIRKEDLAGRDAKIKDQQTTIDTLMKRVGELESNSGGGTSKDFAIHFSNQDRESLGSDIADPIENLLQKTLSQFAGSVNDSMKQVQTSVESMQTEMRNSNDNMFAGLAGQSLKNYDEVKDSEEFKTLMDTEIPGLDLNYSDAFKAAEKNKDFKRMQQIIDMVEIQSDADGDDTDEANVQTKFEPPGGSSEAEQLIKGVHKYKASDYASVLDAYKKGIPLDGKTITAEEFENFEQDYAAADREGKVFNDLENKSGD